MFPSMTKQNMRYRGPMESEKINRFTAAEVYDAVKLSKKLDGIGVKIGTLKTAMLSGDTAAATVSISQMSRTLDSQQQQINQVKGAIS